MEAWKSAFRVRCVSPARAIEAVQSGNRVVLGHAAGEPRDLVRELVRQADRLRGVEIVHMVPLYSCEYVRPEYKEIFTHNALFVGADSRDAINDRRADYTPCFFSEIPRLFREGILPVDVALIQLSPPDEHGYMSFGVSVDYTMQAARSARLTIAEVNSQMPRTHGSFIHVSEVDFLVEADYPLPEIPSPPISEVEERIGSNIASLVPDGSNLQLGIGAIPDAVLKFLGDKKDLGIHTEMFSDGVVQLCEQGVVTNRFNNLSPGKLTASFLMGTRRLYDFVNDNPGVDMRPVDYTNNVMVAGRLEKLISINSAIGGRSEGAGLLRDDRPEAVFRGGRTGRLRARGQRLPGRQVDHRLSLHWEEWCSLPNRGHPQPRCLRHDFPKRRALRYYRVRGRRPTG